MEPSNLKFQDVVELLNSLQKNGTSNNINSLLDRNRRKLSIMNNFIERIGLSIEILENSLSVIHVAGSKGKGSTCAYCESILRAHNFRTGFYSSPHLLSVQERIRINGKPLSESKFMEYFLYIFRRLEETQTEEVGMPTYFQILTVMALYVFLKEEVDVVILEVGIGGAYDCTNILRNVPVVGITSLQLEHTNTLGTSLASVAWHKAGIMKPNCVAITGSDQNPEALEVLKERAAEFHCSLIEVPPLTEYWSKNVRNVNLGIPGGVQAMNASVAVQLAKAWLNRNSNEDRSCSDRKELDLSIDEKIAAGLNSCCWPGRNQVFSRDNLTYYLDGAHTPPSISLCSDWYLRLIETDNNNTHRRVLIFNSTGKRDSQALLEPLVRCDFDLVLFCPNLSYSNPESQPASLKNLKVTHEQMINVCENHFELWTQITEAPEAVAISGRRKHLVKVMASVSDCLSLVDELALSTVRYHILVTGSLHLVGNAINILLSNPVT